MRLHRFYIAEKIGSQKDVSVNSAELANQIRKVFRLKTGDGVILFDGSGNDYTCTISDQIKDDKNIVNFHITGIVESRYMPARDSRAVTLCAGIVKKDTFEWIVEKATELGVTKIIPIMADRSEKKNLNEDRLKKISIEASEQSGRGDAPTIHPIISFKHSFEFRFHNKISAVAFHTEGESFSKVGLAEKFKQSESLELFIGPEGGWSPEEIDLFHKNNIPVVCLGSQILRAETAVVASLALVML